VVCAVASLNDEPLCRYPTKFIVSLYFLRREFTQNI